MSRHILPRAAGRPVHRFAGMLLTVVVLVGVLAAGVSMSTGARATVVAGPVASATPAERAVVRTPLPADQPLTVVGLGDSVMSGSHCNCDGIVSGVSQSLAQASGRRVYGKNLGVTGDTTQDLLARLRTDAPTQRAVSSADVVLLVIGANDLTPQLEKFRGGSCDAECYLPAVESMGTRVGDVVKAVEAQRAGLHTTVLVATYWNVFTDGSVAVAQGGQTQLDWSRQITRAANTAICSAAEATEAQCVDLYDPFETSTSNPMTLLVADGDHPNAAGVNLIVDAFVADLLPS